MKIRHNHKNAIKSACGKKSVKSSSKRRAVKAAYGGWGKFYGLNDVEFTVPNDTDDPTIFYNGKYYNYYAIEDTLWDYYKEECAENGVKPNVGRASSIGFIAAPTLRVGFNFYF